LEWENKFQLTQGGEGSLIGFLLEIEKPKDASEGYELTYGPLLQEDWGKVQYNFNISIQRHVKAASPFPTATSLPRHKSSTKPLPPFNGARKPLATWVTTSTSLLAHNASKKWVQLFLEKSTCLADQGVKWNAAYSKGVHRA
jgi:hypothetical protein